MKHEALEARLLAMKIRTPVLDVKKIVGQLREGTRKVRLYREYISPSGEWITPLASKKTVEKIARLYGEGKLDWILAEELETEGFKALGESLGDTDPNASQLDPSKGDVVFRVPRGIDRGVTSGVFRSGLDVYENRFEQIQDQVPHVDWSINTLLGAGMKDSVALNVLSRRDQAWEAMLDKISYKTMHAVFSLHFLVDFYRQLNNSVKPSHYTLEWAAGYYADGLINDNHVMKQLATAVIKYQSWRSQEHYEATIESLTLTKRQMRSIDKIKHYFQPATKPIQIYR
jgi:hypothetical protein